MPSFNPTAQVARCVENVLYRAKNTDYIVRAVGYELLSRAISLTVLPIALTVELIFKRIPKALYAVTFSCAGIDGIKRRSRIAKVEKFIIGSLFFGFGMISADSVSGMFLKKISRRDGVYPFGVEEAYGKEANVVSPRDVDTLLKAVEDAISDGKQISVVGSGMSQGTQTVPEEPNSVVFNMQHLNSIEFIEGDACVKVGAGANWEQVQIAANQRGKSVIVKQASDVFSIGGSIGINCHGWAHDCGSLSNVVAAIDVVNAEGVLEHLTFRDDKFPLYFGTLGYFGIVVSATLRLVDNDYYIEESEEIPTANFHEVYQKQIKEGGFPLFGGRLNLDQTEGNPLRTVCMVRYHRDPQAPEPSETNRVVTPNFKEEPAFGSRIERLALQAIGHYSRGAARRLLSRLWKRERSNMLQGARLTRNEALHPPIKAFNMFKNSELRTQWLQEYFIKPDNLANFLEYLGRVLRENEVRLINATIRPTPKDDYSILPYAEQERYAVVLCFSQIKTPKEMTRTKAWIDQVNRAIIGSGDVYYQAYMPFTTREQFEACYGVERVKEMRRLKALHDPKHVFGNAHTKKYFDAQ